MITPADTTSIKYKDYKRESETNIDKVNEEHG